MNTKIKINRQIKWLFAHTFILIILFTVFRLFLFQSFNSTHESLSLNMLWYGFRYDIRTIFVIILAIFLFTSIKKISPFNSSLSSKVWNIILTIIYCIVLLTFILDYQWFAYRSNRLDAEIIALAKDTNTGLQMVWQSYPVIKILFFLAISVFIFYKLVQFILAYSKKFEPVNIKSKRILNSIILFVVLAFGIYGKFSTFPLRWSDAFSLNNDFKANMALNSFQSFFSSLQFSEEKPDINKVKKYYSTIANALQMPLSDTILNYNRSIKETTTTKPNVVIVLCESYSFYKSSMSGNALNPTPFFNDLSKEGIFFTNCFSPSYGTARGVWATITGIPDVTLNKTATRNPRAVKQHTILNDFDGYDKYYFLGGDATWANIRGLIKNNITNVHLYEQDDYTEPKVDVWGISDRNLFREATSVLNKNTKPFISVIQTANNHRPYTIPKQDADEMGIITKPIDSLLQNGYDVAQDPKITNEEFNSMRYMDFCIKDFITNAKKQTWFNNTIFLFIGDHGIRGNGFNLIPKAYTDKGLTCEHIPLLIYSPLLKPLQYDFPCSQLDVLPTLAGLAKINYNNATLGRDLMKVANDTTAQKFAFIIDHDYKQYGVIANNYYYIKQLKNNKEELVPINNNKDTKNLPLSYYQNLATGIYETSKYLMFNNK